MIEANVWLEPLDSQCQWWGWCYKERTYLIWMDDGGMGGWIYLFMLLHTLIYCNNLIPCLNLIFATIITVIKAVKGHGSKSTKLFSIQGCSLFFRHSSKMVKNYSLCFYALSFSWTMLRVLVSLYLSSTLVIKFPLAFLCLSERPLLRSQ